MMYMTKVQALKDFKVNYDGLLTPTTRRVYWNEYTDYLYAAKRINERQWRTWTNPFK